ncbi:hypothetical protein BB560_001679 [Smittium megazygosporum]|uniref:Uncharacterized protein n=1 Tax=Smittium megazygosporum TaxID=133381 RepID=A0A2T9ZGV9_9FUNG|nr:hypothetical protein BB560_001679 [Smittium megazygosporum]
MNPFRTFIGISVALTGSIAHSFGLTLQKKAHLIRKQKYSESTLPGPGSQTLENEPPPLYKDTLWMSGFIIFILSSSICPAVALAYLPVFVAAPLSAVNLAANTICAGLVLNIKIYFWEYISTLLVTFGAVWIAVFATIEEKDRSLKDLLNLYKRPIFMTYFSIYEVLVVFLILLELYFRKQYRKYRDELAAFSGNDLLQNPPDNDLSATNKYSITPSEPIQNSDTNTDSSALDTDFYLHDSETEDNHSSMPSLQSSKLKKHTSKPKLFKRSNSSFLYESIPSRSRANETRSSSVSQISAEEREPLIVESSSFEDLTRNFKKNSSFLSGIPLGRNNSVVSEIETTFYSPQISPMPTGFDQDDDSNSNRTQILNAVYIYENNSGMLSGFISGLICSQSILFTKTTVELISLTLKGDNQFYDPLPWFILISLVVTALGNLYYFNRGLRLTSTIVMIPIAFCSYTLSALVNSVVYYNQLGQLSSFQLVMSSFGFVVVLIGVGILSSVQNSQLPKH